MSESHTQLVIGLHDMVARFFERMEKIDDRADALAIQLAVTVADLTRITRELAETKTELNARLARIDEKLAMLVSLKFQVIGAASAISFLLFLAAEALRIWTR